MFWFISRDANLSSGYLFSLYGWRICWLGGVPQVDNKEIINAAFEFFIY
jgi:hypothetical protein